MPVFYARVNNYPCSTGQLKIITKHFELSLDRFHVTPAHQTLYLNSTYIRILHRLPKLISKTKPIVTYACSINGSVLHVGNKFSLLHMILELNTVLLRINCEYPLWAGLGAARRLYN